MLVINRVTDEITPAITTPAQQQTSVITAVLPTAVTQSSSDSDDVVTICVPIVIVFGMIISIVLIVIGILIWKKTKHQSDTPSCDKGAPKAKVLVENDLYGSAVVNIYFSTLC